uniref:Uncharacterized protein n=1 Tax=Panagrolaimus sp. JU765 TaxID=591449 RepID=A0AC34QUR5_9BILA
MSNNEGNGKSEDDEYSKPPEPVGDWAAIGLDGAETPISNVVASRSNGDESTSNVAASRSNGDESTSNVVASRSNTDESTSNVVASRSNTDESTSNIDVSSSTKESKTVTPSTESTVQDSSTSTTEEQQNPALRPRRRFTKWREDSVDVSTQSNLPSSSQPASSSSNHGWF